MNSPVPKLQSPKNEKSENDKKEKIDNTGKPNSNHEVYNTLNYKGGPRPKTPPPPKKKIEMNPDGSRRYGVPDSRATHVSDPSIES